jgi:hypothetical protein
MSPILVKQLVGPQKLKAGGVSGKGILEEVLNLPVMQIRLYLFHVMWWTIEGEHQLRVRHKYPTKVPVAGSIRQPIGPRTPYSL